MRPVFTVDKRSLRELDRAIVLYASKRKKDIPDVVNRAAMNVAFRAAQFTPQAKASNIKTGIRSPYGLTRWIYANRGPIKGAPQDINTKANLERAASRLISIRLASIAFIRAGWLPAAKRLQKVVRRGKGDIKGKRYRKGREGFGYGTPARSALKSFALVVNQSVNPANSSSGAALEQYGTPAADRAVRYVANDMLKLIREPFDKGALEFNRKR